MREFIFLFLISLGVALAAENPAGNARNRRLQEANLRLQLATATPAGIQAACGEILARPRSAATAGAYLVAVEILAEKTGEPALAFARQHPFDPLPARALLEAFVRGWAQSQPDAAEAWLKTATADVTDDDKLELAKVLLRIDAQTDGPRAMKRALRMARATADPYSQRQNFALVVMESLVELGEFQQAREISTSLEPAALRKTVLASLAGLTSDYRPDLAIAWFRELAPGEDRSGALIRLSEGVAARHFRAAVDFFQTLNPGERSLDLAEDMIAHSGNFDRSDIEALLKLLPPGPAAADRVWAAALTQASVLTPDSIPWDFASQITDRPTRENLLINLLLSRGRNDPAGTRALVERFTFLSSDERTAIETHLPRKR